MTDDEHDFRHKPGNGYWCTRCELPDSWWDGEPCPGIAPPRPDPMPVVRIPHCPQVRTIESRVRYDIASWYLQELCDCPHDPDASQWPVHWLTATGTEMHCPCGPREQPAGSGLREIPGGGYACFDCLGRLPGWARGRRVVVDMFCCYCDGVAKARWGIRVDAPVHQVLTPARTT